jgi:hypothetical protein
MKQSHSVPRYELLNKEGHIVGVYDTAQRAGEIAKIFWPNQEQDEDRTGRGWDVQVVGCDR